MEHLSRRTTRSVDLLLVVANPTMPALRSAGRIHDIVRSLKLSVGSSYLVVNRLDAAPEPAKDTPQVRDQIAVLEDAGLPLAADLPHDADVLHQSMAAQGILDMNGCSAALASVAGMMSRLGLTPPT